MPSARYQRDNARARAQGWTSRAARDRARAALGPTATPRRWETAKRDRARRGREAGPTPQQLARRARHERRNREAVAYGYRNETEMDRRRRAGTPTGTDPGAVARRTARFTYVTVRFDTDESTSRRHLSAARRWLLPLGQARVGLRVQLENGNWVTLRRSDGKPWRAGAVRALLDGEPDEVVDRLEALIGGLDAEIETEDRTSDRRKAGSPKRLRTEKDDIDLSPVVAVTVTIGIGEEE